MEQDCFGPFEDAVAELFFLERRWVVIPLWRPLALHHRRKIFALEEPKGLLPGTSARLP